MTQLYSTLFAVFVYVSIHFSIQEDHEFFKSQVTSSARLFQCELTVERPLPPMKPELTKQGREQRRIYELQSSSRFPSQILCHGAGSTATLPPPPPLTSQSTVAPATPPPTPLMNPQTAPFKSSSNFPQNQANFCTQNHDYFVNNCSPDSGNYQVEPAVYHSCYDYSKKCNRPMSFGLSPVQAGPTQTNTQPLIPNLPAFLQSQSPLGDLGGVNSGNPAQYGGPVQGGLGIGKSFQVPFVSSSSGTNYVPTEGFQSGGKGLNVAGIAIKSSGGVNWGDIPGVSNLNQALGLSPNAVQGNQQPSSMFSGRRKRHTFMIRLFRK